MKILYFDCFSGISGDMALGALLDLGVGVGWLEGELAKLRLGGFGIEARRAVKYAVQGTDVHVAVHGDVHVAVHGDVHSAVPEDVHGHPEGDGAHARSFRDIAGLIGASGLGARAKETAIGVFREIAAAEGRVHGQPAEDVHFHEIGAVDSIVDIIGVCACIEALGVDAVASSELHEGRGQVATRHGLLPVPVPAVVEMLKGSGIPVVPEDIRSELATPTGVGILKYFAKSFGPMPPMRVIGAGYGFGKRDIGRLNALRAVLGEAAAPCGGHAAPEEHAAPDGHAAPEGHAAPDGHIVSIEANIDDMTPEALGYAMERLLARGALDVFFTPIYMKKSRPAAMLTVLARAGDADALTDAVFEETTTIGVRKARLARDTMPRWVERAQVPGVGEVRVKVSARKGVRRAMPEYEDVKAAALRTGRPFADVHMDASEAAKTGENARKIEK